MQAGQAGRETLGGPDHPRAAPSRRPPRPSPTRSAASTAEHGRGALVDLDPPPLDRVGQPADQLGRLDAGAVRAEHGPDRPGHARPGRQSPRRPAPTRRRGRAPTPGPRPARPAAGPAGPPVVATARVPPWWMSASMPSVGADLDDVVDRVDQVALEGDHPGPAPRSRGRVEPPVAGHEAGQPAAVAAAGAEADVLGLDDHDAQAGLGAGQGPGRPQPGVAGADDADVGVDRSPPSGRPGGRRGLPSDSLPEADGGCGRWLRAGDQASRRGRTAGSRR